MPVLIDQRKGYELFQRMSKLCADNDKNDILTAVAMLLRDMLASESREMTQTVMRDLANGVIAEHDRLNRR